MITGYEYSDMIHYIVTLPTEERVAIVHSEDFFDRDDLPSVDMWFSTLENLDTYMEQREIE